MLFHLSDFISAIVIVFAIARGRDLNIHDVFLPRQKKYQ